MIRAVLDSDLGRPLDHQGEDAELDVGHDPSGRPVEHRANAELMADLTPRGAQNL
jgi:hypothetical protein